MRPGHRACVAFALTVLAAAPAGAESLRCSGGIASEGDSRLALLYKCGPPTLRDSRCPAVFNGQTPYPVPEPLAGAYVPCIAVEEWLYDRSPGNLLATVRLRSGTVQSITYGRVPQ